MQFPKSNLPSSDVLQYFLFQSRRSHEKPSKEKCYRMAGLMQQAVPKTHVRTATFSEPIKAKRDAREQNQFP